MTVCMTEFSTNVIFHWSLKMFQTADQASSGLVGREWRPRGQQGTPMEDRGLCAARRRVWWSSLILGCRVVRFGRVLIAVPSRGVRHSTTFKPVSILKDADGVMAGLRRIQSIEKHRARLH